MSSIDVLETRERLVGIGVCENGQAEPMAVLLDDLFDQALGSYVHQSTLDLLIEQWRTERAEMAVQQAQFMADIRKEVNEIHREMNEIRKEISDFREENNVRERERDERERQRDERERQRDERERQRDAKWEERERERNAREARLRGWVIGAVGLGFAATTLTVGLLVAFG